MLSKSQEDQVLANLRDGLPRIWWAYYTGAQQTGFTEAQAFSLLQTVILAQCPFGIRPNDPPAPPTVPPEETP